MYYVYIMASISRVIYVGVTGDLAQRVWRHKHPERATAFTAKYRANRLVYYELHPQIRDAITREKQLKGWRRSKKVALIAGENPGWRDLSAEFWTAERV